jgi:signal transduction histidine kinase
VLTAVILATFAAGVGVLTDRRLGESFDAQLIASVRVLSTQVGLHSRDGLEECGSRIYSFDADQQPEIRFFDNLGTLLCSQALSRRGLPVNRPALAPPATVDDELTLYTNHGFRVAATYLTGRHTQGWLLYARRPTVITETESRVRGYLLLGVLGGSVFALLAGLFVARRAMRPIAELTDAAREIERTRDPSRRIPHPEANDEVAELARTLEGMLAALDAARASTEAALTRQREFVADASHELRTPLTAVLANLELLAEELSGEQADCANAALRSTRRMRRLVGDLLLLARADARRFTQHRPTDLADVLMDAAGELMPVAEDHELTVYPARAVIDGDRDDLHRLVLNLLENALSHTPPGTPIRARSGIEDGVPVLVVEDQGPGIPEGMRPRVFDRFVRGGGDTGDGARGTGLGLAIVRAVADAHGATVTLGEATHQPGRPGTRFVITFPAPRPAEPSGAPADTDALAGVQTSTTTGSTIGRRRSRS